MASLRWTWILLGALALAVALACGDDAQEAAPETRAWAEGLPSDAESKLPPPITTPPVRSTELPAEFPADVPRYPGADVVQSRVSADAGMSVTFSVEDDVEKVASFYADGFAAEGWSTDLRPAPNGRAIFADKSERRVAATVVSREEGTLIELIIIRMN